MRKQQTLWTKSGKLLLALGMMFSLVAPYSVHANEPVTPSDGEVTPSNGEQTDTATNPENGVQETKPVTPNNDVDQGIAPINADVVSPVIESVEFDGSGKTFTKDDKVTLKVKAYDAGGIGTIRIEYKYTDEDGGSFNPSYDASFVKTENENEYEVTLDYHAYKTVQITKIIVGDIPGNYQELDVTDRNYIYSYQVEDKKEFAFESFTLKQNNQTLTRDDQLDITAVVPQEVADLTNYIDLRFYNANEQGRGTIYMTLQKENGTNTFKGTKKFDKTNVATTYELRDAGFSTPDSRYDMKVSSPIGFTITGENDTVAPELISIEMTHQKEIVHPGDEVIIKVKAKDNIALDTSNTNLILGTDADILNSSLYVKLIYDEATDTFVGTFKVTKDTYPTEWYINNLNIRDTFGNFIQDFEVLDYGNNPYYVFVQNDGTFVTSSYNVKINFNVLDEKGNSKTVSTFEKSNVERRTSFKDAGIVFPDGSTSFQGLNFIGWTDYNGKFYDENSEILRNCEHLTLTAVYDKAVANVSYKYPAKDGTVKYFENVILMPKESTYGDLVKEASKYRPEDMNTSFPFLDWELKSRYVELDRKLSASGNWVEFIPTYEDKMVIITYRGYFNEKGHYVSDDFVEFYDKDVTYDTIVEKINHAEAPKSFDGLRFKGWFIYHYNSEGEKAVSNMDSFTLEAEYENHLVSFVVDNGFKPQEKNRAAGASAVDFETADFFYAMVAETNETITVPEIPGYTNVTWLDPKPEGENLVIKHNRTFMGYGDKSDDPNPVDPDEPSSGDNSAKGDDNIEDTSAGSGISLPAEKVSQFVSSIASAKAGDTIVVPMDGATVIPVELLESAKGKDVTIKLDMGGYTWSINGKDIMASNLKDINLEVSFDTNAVPSKTVKALAGNNPIKQLSLTHNGDFGFKANLEFNIGSEYNGKYGNLFYYDSDGRLVFMNAGKIGADGNVSLEFSHASDYVIVINDEIMAPDAIKDTSANGSDTFNMLWVMSLAGLGMYFYFKKKETEEQA